MKDQKDQDQDRWNGRVENERGREVNGNAIRLLRNWHWQSVAVRARPRTPWFHKRAGGDGSRYTFGKPSLCLSRFLIQQLWMWNATLSPRLRAGRVVTFARRPSARKRERALRNKIRWQVRDGFYKRSKKRFVATRSVAGVKSFSDLLPPYKIRYNSRILRLCNSSNPSAIGQRQEEFSNLSIH